VWVPGCLLIASSEWVTAKLPFNCIMFFFFQIQYLHLKLPSSPQHTHVRVLVNFCPTPSPNTHFCLMANGHYPMSPPFTLPKSQCVTLKLLYLHSQTHVTTWLCASVGGQKRLGGWGWSFNPLSGGWVLCVRSDSWTVCPLQFHCLHLTFSICMTVVPRRPHPDNPTS